MIDIKVKQRGGTGRALARGARGHLRELMDVSAQTGLPQAQRSPDIVVTIKVPQIGNAPRTADLTVRKLTRVERMLRAKVLEPHEADACEWFAQVAALAWDTTRVTSNYDGGGSGGSAHAPDRLMAKSREIADARDDYREARGLMPGAWGDLFEGIVCRNEALGPAAAAAFPALQRSQAGERARVALKFCANKLHERFGRHMGWRDAPASAVAPRQPQPIAGPDPARVAPGHKLAPEIRASIDLRRIAGAAASLLWLAPELHAALADELGLAANAFTAFDDTPVEVRAHWVWGWVLVDASGGEPR